MSQTINLGTDAKALQTACLTIRKGSLYRIIAKDGIIFNTHTQKLRKTVRAMFLLQKNLIKHGHSAKMLL